MDKPSKKKRVRKESNTTTNIPPHDGVVYVRPKKRKKVSEERYREYKRDDSMSNKQKVNSAITELSKMVNEIDKVSRYNVKLKTESPEEITYTAKSKERLGRISEKLIKVVERIKKL